MEKDQEASTYQYSRIKHSVELNDVSMTIITQSHTSTNIYLSGASRDESNSSKNKMHQLYPLRLLMLKIIIYYYFQVIILISILINPRRQKHRPPPITRTRKRKN